jgi:hypothetical protein
MNSHSPALRANTQFAPRIAVVAGLADFEIDGALLHGAFDAAAEGVAAETS